MSLLIPLLLSACNIELPEIVEPDCDERSLYYADGDGDGAPGADDAQIACEAPSGYLAAPSDGVFDCDDADGSVSTDCAGDTGPDDTGGQDTSAGDDTGGKDTSGQDTSAGGDSGGDDPGKGDTGGAP